MKHILGEIPVPKLTKKLTSRVEKLKDELAISPFADKMKGLIESRIQTLTSKQLAKEMLTNIPLDRVSVFVDTVEGFYHQARLKGESDKKALAFAIGKGIVRSIVHIPSLNEVSAELQQKIESDPEFERYICPIKGTFVGSDAVYFKQRVDENGKPYERYHKKAIKDWLRINPTDPITREPRNLSDIKKSLKAENVVQELIQKKLCAEFYPELVPEQTGALPIKALQSRVFLGSLNSVYPEINKMYEEVLNDSGDPHIAIAEVEASVEDAVSLLLQVAANNPIMLKEKS